MKKIEEAEESARIYRAGKFDSGDMKAEKSVRKCHSFYDEKMGNGWRTPRFCNLYISYFISNLYN